MSESGEGRLSRIFRAIRAALSGQRPVKRHTRSNVTTIEATHCAPEVRKFGICFR